MPDTDYITKVLGIQGFYVREVVICEDINKMAEWGISIFCRESDQCVIRRVK